MNIQGFIFDIDHTLLYSDEAHISAALQAFDEFGLTRTYDDILVHFDKATDDIFRLVAGTDYSGDPLKIAMRKTEILNQNVASIPFYPGVAELLEKIHSMGGKICFASNNYNSVIEAMMKSFHWDEIAVGYVGIDDVTLRKPHPEMVMKSIELLGLNPEECVMVGDSKYDVLAGLAAKTNTIGVCTGHFQRNDLELLHPNLLLDSIGELMEYLPLNFP